MGESFLAYADLEVGKLYPGQVCKIDQRGLRVKLGRDGSRINMILKTYFTKDD